MSKAIYRYQLPAKPGHFSIDMEEGAQILSHGTQGNEPAIWAMITQGARKEKRLFFLEETGEVIKGFLPGRDRFIFTFILDQGSYILHLFETTKL